MRGQPLRFLGVVIAGWVAARVVLLWPDGAPSAHRPSLLRLPVAPIAMAAAPTVSDRAPGAGSRSEAPVAEPPARPTAVTGMVLAAGITRRGAPRFGRSDLASVSGAALRFPGMTNSRQRAVVPLSTAPPPGQPTPVRPDRRSRWSGSAWAIVREGGGSGTSLAPLLGGSQLGVRLTYALAEGGRTAVFARIATPLGEGPSDAAIGLQRRIGRAPVTVFAEARSRGGGVAPAIGAFGGGATAVLAGFRLEGYGQAGLIAGRRAEPYGDAQVRLVRPLGQADGIDAGAGVWAAAQRGVARVDVGPSIGVPIRALPIPLRLGLDWRRRIAGDARPRSGAVLSLGSDF